MRIAGFIASASILFASPALSAPAEEIDTVIRAELERTGGKGLAIAVVEDGQVTFEKAYGVRNGAGDPLTTDTIMYGASLTKFVFAYSVLQLVVEGRLDLDQPIAAMLAEPLPEYGNLDDYGNWGDLHGDDRWRKITPRHALTHSTGFANFSFLEPDGRLRFHFDPGQRYAYSGEGIILLQFGLEQGLGLSVGETMNQRVFGPLGMTRTSMTWRPDFAGNLADGWSADGMIEPHDERGRVRAAGSMDTTIGDMGRFAAALHRFPQIQQLSAPQLPITTLSQFPTLQPEAEPERQVPNLAAGLGVVTFVGPQGPGFFKGGHNDTTGNTFVCVDQARRCVVILTNDVRAEAAFPDIVRAALGETGVPWAWEYGR